MSTVLLADGHLAYDETGSGPPVVLLHGGILDRRMWDEQMTALPGHRVTRFDARGHGESSIATTPYRRADDVIALLDHLDIPTATLVGLSMGGTTALDAALDHPDRVAALVISGSGTSEPYFTDPFIVDLQARQNDAAAHEDAQGYVELFLRAWVDGPTREPGDVDPTVGAAATTWR
jgi:3-oxoadipate enol-lactonase